MTAFASGPIKVRDLFAGTGWGVACQQLGWEEHGIEIMPEAQATRSAAGYKTTGYDVRTVIPQQGEYEGEIASPSCKRYSISGKGEGRRALSSVLEGVRRYRDGEPLTWDESVQLVGDEDAALTLEPLRVALVSMPRFIVWEQVPSVLPVWQACASVLAGRGYSTAAQVLNAEQYGVPQTRRRAVLIARRDGITARMPEPTHSRYHTSDPGRLDDGVQPWISMADALGWGMTARPSMTVTGGGTDTGGAEPFGNAARQGILREQQAGRWSWAKHGITGWPAMRPATTVMGDPRIAAPGHRDRSKDGERHHARSIRVTPQEAAILQSYPPEFPFQGNQGRRFHQIGNAVPPLMAIAILRMFDRPVTTPDAEGER